MAKPALSLHLPQFSQGLVLLWRAPGCFPPSHRSISWEYLLGRHSHLTHTIIFTISHHHTITSSHHHTFIPSFMNTIIRSQHHNGWIFRYQCTLKLLYIYFDIPMKMIDILRSPNCLEISSRDWKVHFFNNQFVKWRQQEDKSPRGSLFPKLMFLLVFLCVAHYDSPLQ